MPNSLINGPEVAGEIPATTAPTDVVPTWGYRGTNAKIFDLKPGEKLPKGWSDTPSAKPELKTELELEPVTPNDDGT